jgi:AraC-like DNA-binding protein
VQEEKTAAIHAVARYIASNLGDSLANSVLEREAGMNGNSFEKEFKRVYSVPPQQYVEDSRMEEAKRQLVQTNLPIAGIAPNVGYSDPNYFSTVFKKKYRMSPTQYRKKNKN